MIVRRTAVMVDDFACGWSGNGFRHPRNHLLAVYPERNGIGVRVDSRCDGSVGVSIGVSVGVSVGVVAGTIRCSDGHGDLVVKVLEEAGLLSKLAAESDCHQTTELRPRFPSQSCTEDNRKGLFRYEDRRNVANLVRAKYELDVIDLGSAFRPQCDAPFSPDNN